MQHISEVENARSKKSREKFPVPSKSCLVSIFRQVQDGFWGGKNGAGKTTIFHSMLKFLEYQGEISLDGQEIRQETYARIGYLPRNAASCPS